ncbi:MAG: DUF5615 family PIN-like protein [Phycisphaerales bacterium]|nr:DUF5615 family PIN-like protein [Phycisphaerales bacterium]
MLAYYFDEDAMNRHIIRAMRSRGVDVVSASEVEMVHRRDEEHLSYAAQHGRVIYSFNVGDFCRLHDEWLRLGRPHAGIVLAHQWRQYSIGTQARGLLKLAAQLSAAEMRDRLEFLSNWV